MDNITYLFLNDDLDYGINSLKVYPVLENYSRETKDLSGQLVWDFHTPQASNKEIGLSLPMI